MLKRYLLNILIWLDIGLNTLVMGGSPYETISSRTGKQADKGKHWACIFCVLLAYIFGPNHCQRAEAPDYGDNLDEVK